MTPWPRYAEIGRSVAWKPSAEGLSDGATLNRCFSSKAVAIWYRLEERGHMRLVEGYLEDAGNFEDVRSLDRSPRRKVSVPLYAVIGTSTGPG